ncbi:MAG: VWA domain-containing protein [Pseudonocardiaceae bacterium]|nr:VWA domain-containing protein [Pseudonocardiaceae bacterium]
MSGGGAEREGGQSVGRHHARHARKRRRSSLVFSSGVLVVLLLAAWLTVDFVNDRFGLWGCDDQVELSVAADPTIAPVIRDVARNQLPEADSAQTRCIRVDVRARDSATVLRALNDPGMGARSLGSPVDVWIPDASNWLDRARDAQPWKVPRTGPSIASSPVVFALSEQLAKGNGWPDTSPAPSSVLKPDDATRIGVADPTTDTAEMYGLHGIVKAAGDGTTATERLRQLSLNGVTERSELFQNVARPTDAEAGIDAFPASEQQLLQHNENIRPGAPGSMVASYSGQLPWLDYPYVKLPSSGDRQRDAANRLLDVLRGGETADVLGAHGLRTADGRLVGNDQDNRVSNRNAKPVATPGRPELTGTMQRWANADAVGQVISVVDVSGSMTAEVSGTGKSRMDVTLEATAEGIGLYKKNTQLALWEFSTRLDGNNDYREVIPYKAAGEYVENGDTRRLPELLSDPKGATGLYDTTLAAYRHAMRHWDAGRINVVVILTDGRNEDPDGIGKDELLAELGELTDSERPLPIVFIGLGTDVDPGELDEITNVTQGQTFLAPDVTDIRKVFFSALSKMSCRDASCGG